jgi:peptidoglycan/LPS O-acetylase OafA/YrhL
MKILQPTANQSPGTKIIGGLDSVRAFAFFAVFLYHFGILQIGYLGVEAFFVLSGFLLTPILVDMKKNLTLGKYFLNFYGRRILRIFPLYYCYLLVAGTIAYFLITYFGYSDYKELVTFWKELPYSLTYTSDFLLASMSHHYSPYAGHFWSLAVEEQFYLLWPFVIFMVPEGQRKRFLLFLIIMGPMIRFIEALGPNYQFPPPYLGHGKENSIYVLPFSYFSAFAFGGFFSLFGKEVKKYQVWMLIVFTPLVGIVAQRLSHEPVALRALGYPPYMRENFEYLWGYSLWALLFSLTIVRVAKGDFFPTVMENPILRYLGKISYGLYVFHLPMLEITTKVGNGLPRMLLGVIALILTIILSILSYEFMEKKFLLLKDVLVPKVRKQQIV